MKHSPRKLRSKRKYHGKANKTTPPKQTFGSDRRQANKSEIKQIKQNNSMEMIGSLRREGENHINK